MKEVRHSYLTVDLIQFFVLYLFLTSLYMITTAGYPTTSMGSTAISTSMSLIEDGDFSLDKPTLETGIGKDGKYYSYEGLAYILVVTVSLIISKFFRIFPHGTAFLNQIIMPIACLLLFLVGRELKYSKKTSILLALVYGVGTMAWVHSRFVMPEPLTAVLYLAAFLFLLKYKNKKGNWSLFLCGCFTGSTLIVRPDAFLFILAIVAGILMIFYGELRNKSRGLGKVLQDGFIFLAPLLFFFAIYAYYNFIRFGNISELGYATKAQEVAESVKSSKGQRVKGIRDTFLGFAGMWIIPCRSMFFINPVLIFIFWAAKDFWKRFKIESIVIGMAFVLHVLLYSNRGPVGFAGSSAWGIRYMVPMTSFMVIIIGVFLNKIIKDKRQGRLLQIFVAVFLLSAIFQVIGSGMTYQMTQAHLEERYNTAANKWKARWMMNMDPRWNLLFQNTKWLLKGKTDFMYYNTLKEDEAAYRKYLWSRGVPAWVGASRILLLLTLFTSGYVLFRILLRPEVEPRVQEKHRRKRKKQRRGT